MLNACSVSKHFYTKANTVTWPVLSSLSCDRIKRLHNFIYITARLNNNASVPAVYNTLISVFWAKQKKILILTNQVLSATEYYHKSISNTWGIVVRYIACRTYIKAILVFISLLLYYRERALRPFLAKIPLFKISETWRDG